MEKTRIVVRWVFAGFMIWIGIQHFVDPKTFVDIMPPFLAAWALELVYISGVFEILGGLGLLIPKTRRAAGWGVIALLIAVYPANIYMAIENVPFKGEQLSDAVRWGRLPFQFLFIWLAYWTSRDPQENDGEGSPVGKAA